MASPSPKLGDTLGHYRLLEQIGAGGMGVVYRAHDERLDRDVALKILPAGAVSEATRVAFRREALALSKLNHPNIATVFDLNHDHGVDYLVMELVSGANLDQMLFTAPLSERDIIRLGMQLAEGLAAAHDQAIVHRDLKPGNVRVRDDGHLKILDFGLARMMHPVSEIARTSSLVDFALAGTLPYMAPEQMRNQRIDGRTDIWALGAVLYEMATGKRAFPETHPPLLIESILHQPLAHPVQVNPQVSPGMAAIILKCLDREPENRYQSAREVAVDLRRLASPTTTMSYMAAAPPRLRIRPRAWWFAAGAVLLVIMYFALGPRFRERALSNAGGSGATAPRVRSIAVLPFENLSGRAEDEYLADGVTDAINSELARFRALQVTSQRSSMQYKNSKKSTADIARELGVDALMEGSVLRVGERVSISARLVEAASDHSVWSDTYERNMGDVLSLRTEVARSVAQEVQLSLSSEEQAQLARASPNDPLANDLYFRGRHQLSRYTPDGYRQALSLFQQAVARDPKHALAYAGIADCYSLMGGGALPGPEAGELAKSAARQALQLDERLPEAHIALGYAQFLYDWDWEGAKSALERALALAPSSAAAHERYGSYLIARGDLGGAQRHMEQARRLDPLNPAATLGLAAVLYYKGENQASLDLLRRGSAESEDAPPPYAAALIYTQMGEYEKALASLAPLAQAPDTRIQALGEMAYVSALAGKQAVARRLLRELQRDRQGAHDYQVAIVLLALGETDRAMAALDQAYARRQSALVWMKADPRLKPIRSRPQYVDLVRRVGL